MKVIILNGERNNENGVGVVESILCTEFSAVGWQTESILLREKKIAACRGCFNCWMKSPGVCTIDDFGCEVAKKVITSDLMIFLTPVTFGGYSSELKKALDRFACSMLLPFFTKINGEVHHKPRYSLLPDLIGIGTIPEKDDEKERIFRSLVERNAINLHSRRIQTAIFYESQKTESMASEVRSLIKNVRERR